MNVAAGATEHKKKKERERGFRRHNFKNDKAPKNIS